MIGGYRVPYNQITHYINKHDIKFIIFDLNGVLDNYYEQKTRLLIDILGPENTHYLPDLLLFIETEYIADRSATIERSFVRFFNDRQIEVSAEQWERLTRLRAVARLSSETKRFLDLLKIPFVIYTALTGDAARKAIGDRDYALFTRDKAREEKPSIANLRDILAENGFEPSESCVVGDGLIDDLMPAALLGLHTILISPYVNQLASGCYQVSNSLED